MSKALKLFIRRFTNHPSEAKAGQLKTIADTKSPIGLRLLNQGEIAVDCGNLLHYKHPDGSFKVQKPSDIKVVDITQFFDHYYQ